MNGILRISGETQTYTNVAAQTAELKRKSVLVADGDETRRSEIKELLDLYNVGVLEARDGEEAIDLIVGECPNLTLINADLPRLDGYEVARLIRNIKSFDQMPIIFLSEQTERSFRKRAFDVGADGFHIEPLDFERLDHILENYLFRSGKTS